MTDGILKEFRTPDYEGAWLNFDGDRMAFRKKVEAVLREFCSDPEGSLRVDEMGPHWNGVSLQISYAHTEKVALLVYSKTHAVGADVEALDRSFKTSINGLAQRYFHPNEAMDLKQLTDPKTRQDEFLKLWVKKEAYAKLTRLGLSGSVSEELKIKNDVRFETVPVTPAGLLASVALRPLI